MPWNGLVKVQERALVLAVTTARYRNVSADTPEMHGLGLCCTDSLLVIHCCHPQAHTPQDGNHASTGGRTQTHSHLYKWSFDNLARQGCPYHSQAGGRAHPLPGAHIPLLQISGTVHTATPGSTSVNTTFKKTSFKWMLHPVTDTIRAYSNLKCPSGPQAKWQK